MGFEYCVDLHVIVDGKISVNKSHEISHIVKNSLQNKFSYITDVLIHIEPATEKRLKRQHVKGQTKFI